MAKSQFYLFLLFLIPNLSSAQSDFKMLNSNNINAFIGNTGTLFYNTYTFSQGYEVPKGTGLHCLFGARLVFAGKNAQGNLFMASGDYNDGLQDFFPGPVSTPGAFNTTQYQADWGNSIWSVCHSDIQQFILWWGCENGTITSGCGSATPPSAEAMQAINSWPAHGNTSMGQAQYLAPFVDYNSDGVYNPNDGDYPCIKGSCAIYLIHNDNAGNHTQTPTPPIGIEVHTMVYQYKTNTFLDNLTFFDVMAINRSTTNYPQFVQSVMVDGDIGNALDDRMWSDSASSTLLFYNGDAIDDTVGGTSIGYGFTPPAISIVGLDRPFTSIIPNMWNTFSDAERWNVLNGLLPDGSSLVNQNGAPTAFFGSGYPIDNPGTPGDRSAYASNTRVGFNSGDTVRQSYAVVYQRSNDNISSAFAAAGLSTSVQQFYDQIAQFPCNAPFMSDETASNPTISLNVYPNPSNGIFHVSAHQLDITSLSVFNVMGQRIFQQKTFPMNSTYSIDIQNQVRGMYLMEIQTTTGTVRQKIFLE